MTASSSPDAVRSGSDKRGSTPDKLIFIHIPKTAGTSLRRLVRQQYPTERFEPVYSHDPAFLASLRERMSTAWILYGHLSFGFHELMGVSARYVTLLRDPVARVLSLYRHQLANTRANHHAAVRAVGDLRTLLERNVIHEFNNHMTRILSGNIGTGFVDDDALLERAIGNIREGFELVGLVERLDDSVAMLARRLNWHNVSPLPHLNAAKDPHAPVPDRSTLRAVEDYNRLDRLLYQWVADRFTV